ncbi:MAG TPA: matrixin family metalloprotease [Polyangiaceae bacterium]|nr:matrixin family metalloprotease [Polyangiaceae bacterium]
MARVVGSGHVTTEVRSGSPGFRSTPSGKQVHWTQKAVTIYIDSSLKQLGPSADEAVMQAFGQWVGSDPQLPDLSFDTGKTSAEPKQDGMSTVSLAKIQVPGHEHDVAITVTYSNDKTGEIVEADVVLNALYPMGTLTAKAPGASNGTGKNQNDDKSHDDWRSHDESIDCGNRYDAQNVVTHEAGHFFGLGEDMTERKATMFLSIDQCETHKRVLSATDTTAITTLYAANQDPEEATAGRRACSFGVAPAAGSAWISGLMAGLLLLRRRRAR